MLQLAVSTDFPEEKTYATGMLLTELLGITVEILRQPGLKHYRLQLPNGAVLIIEDHFFGRPADGTYLIPENIPSGAVRLPHPFEPGMEIAAVYGRAYYSAENQKITCGIDLFASAFFMLTRWEEFVNPERDRYGRFPAAAAWAYRNRLLDRPLVNEYAELLWQMLVQLGWKGKRKQRSFQLHLSHDVDHPRLWWSATDRVRTLAGSLFRRKNSREAAWWCKNHLFRTRDPYDIFDTWMDFSERQGIVSHFNFLGDRPARSDCYYPLEHPFVRHLLEKITARGHVTGFHPSREAAADPKIFAHELGSLQRVTAQPIRTGRQHYLCFAAPDTWQCWADADMEWDSTLGYSEAEGFRCGICCDFPVFNFLTRQTLALREKPLLAMDVTLAQHRQYTPTEAADRLQHLYRQVKKHRGEFVLLWHNSSWNTYFWAPWQAVYREFVESCR